MSQVAEDINLTSIAEAFTPVTLDVAPLHQFLLSLSKQVEAVQQENANLKAQLDELQSVKVFVPFSYSVNNGYGYSTNNGFGYSANNGFGYSANNGFGYSASNGFRYSANNGFGYFANNGFGNSVNDGINVLVTGSYPTLTSVDLSGLNLTKFSKLPQRLEVLEAGLQGIQEGPAGQDVNNSGTPLASPRGLTPQDQQLASNQGRASPRGTTPGDYQDSRSLSRMGTGKDRPMTGTVADSGWALHKFPTLQERPMIGTAAH
eukprot:gene20919-27767_t